MKKTKRKILSLLLTAVFVLSLMPSVMLMARAASYNINDVSIQITSSGNYVISGNGNVTANSIVVSSGVTANITLSGVQIDASSVYSRAFYITSGATVNLTLSGNNTLKGGLQYAGLQVPAGAIVNISGSGSLTATGGDVGSGIGGASGLSSSDGNSGTINISGGTVTAYAGDYGGAAIGGGNYGSSGPINISGGTVTATTGSSDGGAAIGGGVYSNCGNVNISGGTVTAITRNGSAAIGGGGGDGSGNPGGAGGIVTITGNNTLVSAQSTGGGHAIGSGSYNSNGGSLTVGSTGITTAPLPTLALQSGGTNAAVSFKNCLITNTANAEMSGTFGQDGYIHDSVTVFAPPVATVGGNNVLTASIVGYSGGTVQFSYKTDGDASYTNIGGTVSLISGTATTNFAPIAAGNYTIKADYSCNLYRTGSSSITVTVKDPALASLVMSAGTLSPSFDLSQKEYTVNVGYDVASLAVTPTVHESHASITVNGSAVVSGSPSGSIALPVNVPTDITVIVTAQDGMTTSTYKVTVTRSLPSTDATLSSLALSAGALSQPFDSSVTDYTTNVGYYVSSMVVTPTVNEQHATVTVNGTAVTGRSPSASIPLTAGVGTDIIIKVTAQDSIAATTYKVRVTRSSAQADSALSGLSLSVGALSPAFVPNNTDYTVNVSNDTKSVAVTPTVDYPGSTVTVNGTAVQSGQASVAIELTDGATATINVVVTALDGVTKTTYTINATCAFRTDSALTGLSISPGTLSPAFASGTTNYTVNVFSTIPSLTVTPTVEDTSATVMVNGSPVASGAVSGRIVLTSGASTIIYVVVTAQDGATKTTYSITVNDISPTQAINSSSLGNIEAPSRATGYQHVYYGGNRWNVLSHNGSTLFMLSTGRVVWMCYSSQGYKLYNTSDIRTWLMGTYIYNFSAYEQAAMKSCFQSDKLALLSPAESMDSSYSWDNGASSSLQLPNSERWWLSYSGAGTGKVPCINRNGYYYYDTSNDVAASDNAGVRPVIKIDTSKIVLTAPASNGTDASESSTLAQAMPLTGDMKLTIANGTQTLTVDSVTADNVRSGSTVTVAYSGASTGTNQYLCVNLATDSASYRGVIKTLTSGNESGTATFTLPTNVTQGQFMLSFWNEQYNAAQCTNFASVPVGTGITPNTPVITKDALPEGTIGTAYSETIAVSGGTAPYSWRATGLPTGLTMDASGTISGTPEPDDAFSLVNPYSVEITVKDSNNNTDIWNTTLKINPEAVALLSASADGAKDSSYSTQIALTFDKAVVGLTADNITMTNGTGSAVKGTLTGSGANWSIGLSSVTAQGEVSVAVSAPTGYAISSSPVIVAVYTPATPSNSAISPTTASFDKYSGSVNYADIAVGLTLNGNTLSGIYNGATKLTSTDTYTVSDSTHLIILKSYLAAQPVGATTLTFKFSGGSDQTLTLSVADTTPSTSGATTTGGTNTPTTNTSGGRTTATTDVTPTVGTDGTATATTTKQQLADAVSAATENAAKQGTKAVVDISVDTGTGTKGVTVTIPQDPFHVMVNSGIDALQISSPFGTVTFDKTALAAINKSAASDITVKAVSVDKTMLSDKDKSTIGNRPVYDLSVTSGGSKISGFGGGTATISIPYTPASGEDANSIVIYYVSADGGLMMVPNCVYDPATGNVTFKTTHFSTYAVGYNDVRFTDVSGWYTDYVSYLAARGIIGGTGDGKVSPDASITRAQFVTILARMSGDDLSGYTSSSFSDVSTSDWYFAAVQWAFAKGIVSGYDGMFNPNAAVTRQDIAVMLARYADKVSSYTLPKTNIAVSFTDSATISAYSSVAVAAMQQAGIISGTSDGSFAPIASATRAEAAKMIAVLLQGMVG